MIDEPNSNKMIISIAYSKKKMWIDFAVWERRKCHVSRGSNVNVKFHVTFEARNIP